MSTFADLIADVDQAVRENTTEKNAFLLSEATRVYQRLLRQDDWPQTRVPGFTVTLVSGTQAYDLPADFDRYAGERVNYFIFNSAQYNAITLPILRKGSSMGDTRASLWEGIVNPTPYSYPQIIGTQSGGANTYQLVLYPLAGNSGDTIIFDYYSVPQRNEVTTATVIAVDQLYETLFNFTAAGYSRYINDQLSFGVFTQTAKDEHKIARQTLMSL